MTCQSVTDGYIIKTASILAVKIVLPNPLLSMSRLYNVKLLLLWRQSRGEDQTADCHLKSFALEHGIENKATAVTSVCREWWLSTTLLLRYYNIVNPVF